MHIRQAEFIISAASLSQLPVDGLPEVAFAGRSNVGKSSLLNMLLQRKKLVRTGSRPGRTQQLNYFLINRSFYFVDLPGYGYAQVSQQQRRQWGQLMQSYLSQRQELLAVVWLQDIRRDPGTEDNQLLDWLEERNCPTVPVLTKADKVGSNARRQQLARIAKVTGISQEDFTLCSATSAQGRDELWQRLGTVLFPETAADD